jgi:hypothetical protein
MILCHSNESSPKLVSKKIRHAEKVPSERSDDFGSRIQFLSACRKWVWLKRARNVGLFRDILSSRVKPVTSWLGREGSNLRMSVPKTDALPLGDAPIPREPGKPIEEHSEKQAP